MASDPLKPQAKFIDTALQPDDDAPSFDDDGQTHMRPAFDEFSMLEVLENPGGEVQAQLSPQQAYEEMKYSAPLSEEEREILNETPFLGPELTYVDDADHTEWLLNRAKDKRAAMDFILEDQMYGEDLGDDELGFGLSSLTHALKRAGGAVTHAALMPAHLLANVVKKFVPSRDAQKARLLRQTNARLVQGRANFLQMHDIRSGIRNRPRSYYLARSRPWARSRLASAGLPTTYTSGEVASAILGAEASTMGSWWNPFSWFQAKTKYVVQNAQGQIAEMSQDDFNNWLAQQQGGQVDPSQQATADPSMAAVDPSTMQPVDPSTMQPVDPSMMAPVDPSTYAQGDDDWTRAIDLHQIAEKASRGDKPSANALNQIAAKAAAGDAQATNDMNEIRKYQRETGMKVTGDDILGDEDGSGAFSHFAGEVTSATAPARAAARATKGGLQISDSQYRELMMKSAQRATGQPIPSTAALGAAHKRLSGKLAQKGVRVVDSSGTDMMGAWLYKLSPFYWLKSERERKLIDAEKENWEKAKDTNKENAKKAEVLDAAKRAQYQKEQAEAAQQQSQEMESQLEDIEKSVAAGELMGADLDATLEAAQAGKQAARANGKQAGALADKLEAGEKLSPDEISKLRSCMKMCQNLRALHDQLHAKTSNTAETTSGIYHDYTPARGARSDFLGNAETTEIIGENPAEILGEHPAEILGAAGGSRPSIANLSVTKQRHLVALTAIAATNPKGVSAYAKKNGLKLSSKDLQNIQIAAGRARAIMNHPAYGSAVMKGDELVVGDDAMGFSWTKLLTAPLAAAALPAAAITWGMTKVVQAPAQLIKWGAKKGGWFGGSSSSQPAAPGMQYTNPQAIQASLQAAQARQAAAQQRIMAANAADAQAQQQYAANAAAADAEAQAQEAEAQAQQDQMDAQQAQYMPADGGTDDDSGRVTVLGAEFFSGAFVGEVEDPKAKKIVEEAQKDTPTGKKIRAGATLYHKARKGDPKAKLAVAKIQAKARTGDPQAQRDYNAVKAGKIAIHAKGKAKWRLALKAKKEAANKRGIAIRKHLEASAGKKLGEHTRRKKLAKIAKVERLAAQGHPKAKAAIAKTVAKAHAGDKKAQTTVAALQLAKHVRTAGKTPAERKRLHEAHKVVLKARHGNKKAIRQIALIQAAAKQGQPNAKRAHARLKVAARVEHAVATGHIKLPPKKEAVHAQARKHVQHVKNRIALNVASKEEAMSAAKVAHSIGDRKSAGELAYHAAKLPSAKTPIKQAAVVAAAANNGSPQAKKVIDDTLEKAQTGDPAAIAAAGHLAAAQSIDAVNKGKPMPAPIAEATQTLARARAGDEEAKRTIQRAGAAAEDPNHPNHAAGVEAAVALSAAAATAGALAGNALATKKWHDEAKKATGTHIDSSEHAAAQAELAELMAKLHAGTATYTEGLRARSLAMALDQPKTAAEISAIMPPRDTIDAPMSSLPDLPEPPIRGVRSFLKEVLRALTFSTPDPFGNYREGIRSRGEG